MQTPEIYKKNLNNGIITLEMLDDCLFSCNKRAKNHRDKKREYVGKLDDYSRWSPIRSKIFMNIEHEKNEMAKYYAQKELMLQLLTPVCIHSESFEYPCRACRTRTPRYEEEFDDYDSEEWEDYEEEHGCMECDGSGIVEKKKYYLFYQLPKHTYHTPIDDPNEYNLEVVGIDSIKTSGENITDLVSTQFVNKVIDLIRSKNYSFVEYTNAA